MAGKTTDMCGDHFTHADLERVVRTTFVECVDYHDEIHSTNDRALELARQDAGPCPVLVLAENQTAGRGRGANRWWAARGALTFSLLIESQAMRLPTNRWPHVSLVTGLAVCEAVEDLLSDVSVRLKWPNDVYLNRRKLCGVLIELPPERPTMIVMGIGINVNNSLRDAPSELQDSATAMCEAAGRRFDLPEVLQNVLSRLAERLNLIGNHDDALLARWRERCLLTNRIVRVDLGTRSVSGLCRGIDGEGALVLETDAGRERYFAGVVTRF